jgi:hypothetical protein
MYLLMIPLCIYIVSISFGELTCVQVSFR